MTASLKNPSFVKTFNGSVECIGEWGHGHAAAADFHHMPGILTADDGDGHFFAYRCLPGKTLRQTAEALAPLFLRNDGGLVAVFSGSHLSAEPTPFDFLIEQDDGDFVADLARHPNVIGY